MTESNVSDFDFSQPKIKRQLRKKRVFVKCLDCRAVIGSSISNKYQTCPFCDGANWSDDNDF